MATPKATLGGKTILGSRPARWTFRPGVKPVIEEFDLTPADAKALTAGPPIPINLVMNDLTVRDVYVLRETPGPSPHIASVKVADRRWLWERNFIKRTFNLRRHIGLKRLDPRGGLGVVADVVRDVWYAPFSLPNEDKNSQPFTARQILELILNDIAQFEGTQISGAQKPSIRFGPYLQGRASALPIENMLLDDPGDAAVMRLLAYLPEAQITIDKDGIFFVYSRADGAERFELKNTGPPSVKGDVIDSISFSRMMPREIHVLFTREQELRFDFEEKARVGDTVTLPGGVRTTSDRALGNVLKVPDFNFTVGVRDEQDAQVTSRIVSQGTWLSFDDYLASLPITPPPFSSKLDYEHIRRALVPYIDLWAPLSLAGLGEPDADWSGRISAINHHYRRSYRIPREWMDRIFLLNADRLSIIDPEQQGAGGRAPAMAWSDYCILNTMRPLSIIARQDGFAAVVSTPYATNHRGFPSDGLVSRPNARNRLPPITVSIQDHDQGIIRLDYKIDEYRTYEQILPGTMDNIPGPSLRNRSGAITFDGVDGNFASVALLPTLSAGHKAAVIMSAVPGSPNNDAQLYRIKIKPQDVTSVVPANLTDGLRRAVGPIYEYRVGAEVDTARFAWHDSAAQRIVDSWFQRADTPEVDRVNLDDLLINGGQDDNGASLQRVAIGVAAKLYAEFADRIQGNKTTGLDPRQEVDGWLASITHILDREGRTETTYALFEDRIQFSPYSLMDPNTRALVTRRAQHGKGS